MTTPTVPAGPPAAPSGTLRRISPLITVPAPAAGTPATWTVPATMSCRLQAVSATYTTKGQYSQRWPLLRITGPNGDDIAWSESQWSISGDSEIQVCWYGPAGPGAVPQSSVATSVTSGSVWSAQSVGAGATVNSNGINATTWSRMRVDLQASGADITVSLQASADASSTWQDVATYGKGAVGVQAAEDIPGPYVRLQAVNAGAAAEDITAAWIYDEFAVPWPSLATRVQLSLPPVELHPGYHLVADVDGMASDDQITAYRIAIDPLARQ